MYWFFYYKSIFNSNIILSGDQRYNPTSPEQRCNHHILFQCSPFPSLVSFLLRSCKLWIAPPSPCFPVSQLFFISKINSYNLFSFKTKTNKTFLLNTFFFSPVRLPGISLTKLTKRLTADFGYKDRLRSQGLWMFSPFHSLKAFHSP